jgi:hypothetical protein
MAPPDFVDVLCENVDFSSIAITLWIARAPPQEAALGLLELDELVANVLLRSESVPALILIAPPPLFEVFWFELNLQFDELMSEFSA